MLSEAGAEAARPVQAPAGDSGKFPNQTEGGREGQRCSEMSTQHLLVWKEMWLVRCTGAPGTTGAATCRGRCPRDRGGQTGPSPRWNHIVSTPEVNREGLVFPQNNLTLSETAAGTLRFYGRFYPEIHVPCRALSTSMQVVHLGKRVGSREGTWRPRLCPGCWGGLTRRRHSWGLRRGWSTCSAPWSGHGEPQTYKHRTRKNRNEGTLGGAGPGLILRGKGGLGGRCDPRTMAMGGTVSSGHTEALRGSETPFLRQGLPGL